MTAILTIRRRNFYPRPPRGGRRPTSRARLVCRVISIHALREEGDMFIKWIIAFIYQFLSTPSARRATFCPLAGVFFLQRFLSTPSARRATEAVTKQRAAYVFLSTPSARRATIGDSITENNYSCISIHALREEGDTIKFDSTNFTGSFLSTPSARRATHRRRFPRGVVGISIHALREEGDDL